MESRWIPPPPQLGLMTLVIGILFLKDNKDRDINFNEAAADSTR